MNEKQNQINMENKFILDACCGPRWMWNNKHHPNTIYIDIREEDKGFSQKDKQTEIKPDIIMDCRKLKFQDKSFKLIVFDPPHIKGKDYNSNLKKCFGYLDKDNWKVDLKKCINEMWRCLEDYGILIFKFSDCNIPFKEVLSLFPEEYLFGNTKSTSKSGHKTKWFCFMKIPKRSEVKTLIATQSTLSNDKGT
jgi:hypothetical protein